MKFYFILLIVLIITLILFYYEELLYKSEQKLEQKSEQKLEIEQFGNYNSSCGKYPELLKKAMEERNMVENKEKYDVYIPCSYNSCEKDILAFESDKSGKKIFLIDGCDWVGSKMALWELLKENYGDSANKYMPESYLLDREQDLKAFSIKFYENKIKNPNQMYVLKNYAQRQEGIKLTMDHDEIIKGINNGWYLAQEYKYDPYIIDKRKINFRYYLLIVCKNNTIEAYIHKDGFLYYTPEFYDANDMTFDKHITTGYVDRAIYEKNPLTLEDFRVYLDSLGCGLRQKWDFSANNLMNKVMEAISKKICKNKKLDNHVRFQLFGCDLAPTSNLEASLMEINKGPDLSAKDERDMQVKLKVQKDIFSIVDPIDNECIINTRFDRIF
jgi:hypothetical protein